LLYSVEPLIQLLTASAFAITAAVPNLAKSVLTNKKRQVILFSSTAIAVKPHRSRGGVTVLTLKQLYGYDQGMMSLINTNYSYLSTMGICEEDPLVGVIVSVYYLGCAVGAVFFSWLADQFGRKKGIFFCLATASLGNLIMFIAGLGYERGALAVMFLGRVVMGLGVGGVDSVIPVFSSELSPDEARGKALAQEFQMNIFGLNAAFGINLGGTVALGKNNQWAWRIPIIVMQGYPLLLLAFVEGLPESPRWFIFHDKEEEAKYALVDIYGKVEGEKKHEELVKAHDQEAETHVGYREMFTPGHPQFHPTIITIMGQVNQALTGYGAVSVYGPQIFELLGFGVRRAEYLTPANYISYFILMTFAWLPIDAVGRRKLMTGGSVVLTVCFALLTVFGGLAMIAPRLHIPTMATAVPGIVTLFVATGAFGIGWLATVWLIPTEIYPTAARAQGTAVSVIIWGLANFAITLLTPIMFNSLKYWIFLVFAASNAFAGVWTWIYLPESGNRSFEENQEFFDHAKEKGTWRVAKVDGGAYLKMPYQDHNNAEEEPLLSRVQDQLQT
jgi:sugar porter (SP) family MFS transporter